MSAEDRIIPINIEEEMKSAYIDYSMSVIVSRALPDVRDGLKPVHRRVLYGMNELGLVHNKAHKKSARIVGEVLGKYHPHGDTSVYDAMVRMAQHWSLRYMLVDGQGNFGSVDGDSPAAMRYTEARLKKMAEEMLSDIDKDTVDFRLNFDDTLEEPTVLPARIPNLLVNGASGIAVGMATNMLPHNLSEVIDGTVAFIDNNDITVDELMQHVKGPDFPTGGIMYGISGARDGFETGRGRIVVRCKADIVETKTGKTQIIISEIPYQVNKAALIAKTAELINNKKIEGISDVRDESDRKGMRIVYDLKRDAHPSVVLNQLYKLTSLQSSYGVNNICLVDGRPRLLNLRDIIQKFVEFRHEVIVRRTQYELKKAQERAHILEGLLIALDHIDEIIKLIRASQTPEEARAALMTNFELSELQARAILDMRLQRLTGLERDKIQKEYDDLLATIAHLEEVLAKKELRMGIIRDELLEIKDKYGDERRTEITIDESDISIEDIIENEPVVVTISHLGYIKRTKLDEFREQGRGGTGSKGGSTRNEDFIEHLFVTKTHNYMLFFTEKGRCHWLKVYQIPEGTKTSKGRPIQNILQLPRDGKILAFITIENLADEDFQKSHSIIFCTKKGVVKKTSVEAFARPRKGGINAITIREGDELIDARLTDGTAEIVIAAKSGKAIRFTEEKVRSMGRTAAGVRGMTLAGDKDEVVGMVAINEDAQETATILVVSEKGYGKRSKLDEYRITNRGGKGVKTINVTDKTGSLVAIKNVTEESGLMIINRSGITIRMSVADISVLGRATQGVRLIRLKGDDEIAGVAKILSEYDQGDQTNEEEE